MELNSSPHIAKMTECETLSNYLIEMIKMLDATPINVNIEYVSR